MSDTYKDNLDPAAKARYRAKLDMIGLETCPYKLGAHCYIDDPTMWPSVEYGDIYNYLINSPGLYEFIYFIPVKIIYFLVLLKRTFHKAVSMGSRVDRKLPCIWKSTSLVLLLVE